MDDRRTDQHDTQSVDQRRRVNFRELLVVNDLLRERRAASAVLLGPADSDPSARVHLLVPLDPALPVLRADFADVFAHDVAAIFGLRRLGQVGMEPAAKLLAKRLVCGAEIEIHWCLRWGPRDAHLAAPATSVSRRLRSLTPVI